MTKSGKGRIIIRQGGGKKKSMEWEVSLIKSLQDAMGKAGEVATKVFSTAGGEIITLVVLLAIVALAGGGSWFFTAASGALFGLAVVGLPFAVRARPVRNLIGDFSRPLIVLAADVILFANLMNMVSLHSKSAALTILMALACVAGAALLVYAIKAKRGEAK